jgi:hypothetical protein
MLKNAQSRPKVQLPAALHRKAKIKAARFQMTLAEYVGGAVGREIKGRLLTGQG